MMQKLFGTAGFMALTCIAGLLSPMPYVVRELTAAFIIFTAGFAVFLLFVASIALLVHITLATHDSLVRSGTLTARPVSRGLSPGFAQPRTVSFETESPAPLASSH